MTETRQQTTKKGHARLMADLVEMLSGIKWYDRDLDIATFLDPLVRPAIEARFAELPDDMRARVRERINALSAKS